MGSIAQLVWIIALIVVVGLLVLTACICVVSKVADAEKCEYQRRKAER
jgi:hypothetical protein